MSFESGLRPDVPDDFTKPSGAYRLQAWLAFLGLLLFVFSYLGLASFFTWTAYRMIAGALAGGDRAFRGVLAALPAGFFAVFMWQALFFVRHGSARPGVEITADDEPELFDFLYDLADQVKAPRPHRVFLSPDVNACVFYDLSILNFLLPSKKNLIIGLGLVNSLTRSELKAVVAHEFGHFAQRSMAVGRWVYIGEQIAGHIIANRGFLDRTLDFISSIDLRVAWIGWIMRIIVWSIRSLMETIFRIVIIAHRALSREMEFQADLVAVSVTGSDALVHGLYRLQPADEDWAQSLSFADEQLQKKRLITDIFTVQSSIGRHMERILGELGQRHVPEIPAHDPASHRVFTEEIAQPPRMWSTHPPNTEREENAKRTYIPARLDNEPAWSLFQDSSRLRKDVTAFMLEGIEFKEPPEELSDEAALAAVDELYTEEIYRSEYQGVYLGRRVTTVAKEVRELYDPAPVAGLTSELASLYPDGLKDEVVHWRKLCEETALLEAIKDGVYDAPGGVIRYRGQVVRKSGLDEVISRVQSERDGSLKKIEAHDRRCRSVHDAVASNLSPDWQKYHSSLVRLLHNLEHSEADLTDAGSHLAVTTSFATVTGRVNQEKLNKVMSSARDLHDVMRRIDDDAAGLRVPDRILTKLGWASWRDQLDKLELPPPHREQIGEWLNVIDSWLSPMQTSLSRLRQAVLSELLETERTVASIYRDQKEASSAPGACSSPENYHTRRPGTERKKPDKLDWWSRFTVADGTVPTLMRLVVAVAIVGCVVFAGSEVGDATVTIYNGLSIPVTVEINDEERNVFPYSTAEISVGSTAGLVETTTQDAHQIETFDVTMDKGFANYVYNVAGAAALMEETAVYGNVVPRAPVMFGCPRWQTTGADHVFTEPPVQIKSSGKGGTRTVLRSFVHPGQVVATMTDQQEIARVAFVHAEWDSSDSEHIAIWLRLAEQMPGFDLVLERRLQRNPNDVVVLRSQQDSATEENRAAVLARHTQLADEHPDDPDLQYIGIRARPDGAQQDAAFVAAYERWPNHAWLANASAFVFAARGDWQEAQKAFTVAHRANGPASGTAALRLARIRRYVATGPVDLNDLLRRLEVQSMLALEQGGLQDPASNAYSMLNRGQLQQVRDILATSDGDHLKILLGASEGAAPPWQEAALAVPLDELEHSSLLYLAALAFRRGDPHQKYLDQFLTVSKDYYSGRQKTALEFVEAVMKSGPNPELESLLHERMPVERGYGFTAAIIMFPDSVPQGWRRAARAFLFASERPWFAKPTF